MRPIPVTLGSGQRIIPRREFAFLEQTIEGVSRPDPPNYAILRVNKQICGEALQAAWDGTTKHFPHPCYFQFF
jgi:hypothetical protein